MSDENDVQLKFGANIEGVEEGSEKAGEALKQLKEHVDALKESGEQLHEIFATMLEAAGLEIGLDAFKEWIASSAELGEAMERAGAMLGITGEQASELAGVAKLTGTSFDGLDHTMERFELGLASAGEKTSHVAEALRVLGLSAREFVGVPINQQLARMAEAFSQFAEGLRRPRPRWRCSGVREPRCCPISTVARRASRNCTTCWSALAQSCRTRWLDHSPR